MHMGRKGHCEDSLELAKQALEKLINKNHNAARQHHWQWLNVSDLATHLCLLPPCIMCPSVMCQFTEWSHTCQSIGQDDTDSRGHNGEE